MKQDFPVNWEKWQRQESKKHLIIAVPILAATGALAGTFFQQSWVGMVGGLLVGLAFCAIFAIVRRI